MTPSKAFTYLLKCGAIVYVNTVGDTTALVQPLPDQRPTDAWPEDLERAHTQSQNAVVPISSFARMIDLSTLSSANRDVLAHLPEPPDPEDDKYESKRQKRLLMRRQGRFRPVPAAKNPTSKAGVPRCVYETVCGMGGGTVEEVAAKLVEHPGWVSKQDPARAASWWLKVFVEKGALTLEEAA